MLDEPARRLERSDAPLQSLRPVYPARARILTALTRSSSEFDEDGEVGRVRRGSTRRACQANSGGLGSHDRLLKRASWPAGEVVVWCSLPTLSSTPTVLLSTLSTLARPQRWPYRSERMPRTLLRLPRSRSTTCHRSFGELPLVVDRAALTIRPHSHWRYSKEQLEQIRRELNEQAVERVRKSWEEERVSPLPARRFFRRRLTQDCV